MTIQSIEILEEINRVRKAVNATRPIELGKPIELTSEAAEVTLSKMDEYLDKLVELIKPVDVISTLSILHDYERHEYRTPIVDTFNLVPDNSILFRLDLRDNHMLSIFIRPKDRSVYYGASSIRLLETTDWDSVHLLVEEFINEVKYCISE